MPRHDENNSVGDIHYRPLEKSGGRLRVHVHLRLLLSTITSSESSSEPLLWKLELELDLKSALFYCDSSRS